ncbi:MAG: ABC transporter substrate-binding protein [Rhodopseudomonas palustris]|uniref:ABC transporter substrate-binding protein n=1 Tax=Rhodopseudomonas palustris TaxID=1076 RepID=A0A933S1H0_RHOPL|nr:ABC transporter substrate-binding protein [Rhodopseudomonas palustris]
MRDQNDHALSRRKLLLGAAATSVALPAGLFGAQALPGRPAPYDFADAPICRASAEGAAPVLTGAPRKLKFSWNANAVCSVQVPVAIDYGFFQKQNLDVELVNFSGSTDQLLEAIATGKSDGGVGMALRWLKPLEQGFDVKIVAGTHGGCLRALAPTKSGIKTLTDLKGKIVATADLTSPDKNFFSIQLAKAGIDPVKDVEWRQYPGNLVRLAVEKGEVHALTGSDPLTYAWLKDGEFTEIGSNLNGIYANVSCCVVGARASLIRDEPLVARALTQGLLDAAQFCAKNPEKAAKSFLPFAPKTVTEEDLVELIRYHTHDHHPTGAQLKNELKLYADDLKVVSVIKQSTDTTKFADRIYADVFRV